MSRQEKIKEKRRLARLQKSRKEKADDVELDAELDESDENIDVSAKSYPYDAIPSTPATSFAELDKYEEMEERAEKVREVSWQVQDLINNILYHPEMKPNEKADAIQKVGSEFGARVQNAISEDVSQMAKASDDMDLLVVKSLIAMDSRSVTAVERMSDWISKKKLTASAEKKLSDDDFALVYEKDGVSVRKYPIHDKAHVRNALARAAQMIEQGGDAADDAKKALPKIRSAAKKMGIGVTEKSSLIVEKAADGNWRAVMFPTNKWIDWHGDILSEQSHLEYVDWVSKNMDSAPLFMTWHVPGTARESRVDFVGYDNGFLVASAPLTENEAAGILRAQAETDLGMSHTSIVLGRDPNDPKVVTKYRMVEVTDLPLDAAANPFTSFDLIDKEADMAKLDTQKYLANILGSEEKAAQFLERAGLKKKELESAEVPSKEKDEKPDTSNALTMEQVIEQVSKEFGIEELSKQFADLSEKAQKVDALEELVKELTAKKEDALAEMITPKAARGLSWMSVRPSQKDDTVLKKEDEADKKLSEAKPSGGWLSDISKTAPIQEV